jgi:hypothetical protein
LRSEIHRHGSHGCSDRRCSVRPFDGEAVGGRRLARTPPRRVTRWLATSIIAPPAPALSSAGDELPSPSGNVERRPYVELPWGAGNPGHKIGARFGPAGVPSIWNDEARGRLDGGEPLTTIARGPRSWPTTA